MQSGVHRSCNCDCDGDGDDDDDDDDDENDDGGGGDDDDYDDDDDDEIHRRCNSSPRTVLGQTGSGMSPQSSPNR